VQVSQDYLPDAPFLELKTYQWQSEKQKSTGDARVDNPLLNNRIRTAINQFLGEQGFRLLSEGKPDFYISYHYSIRSKIESSDTGGGVGFGFGSFGRFGGIGINTGQEIREYDQAALLIDFLKPQSNDLIWRGTGTRRVNQHATPEESTKTVNEMVAQILKQFPPLPGGK
jgi:hypothetical protein